MRPACILSCILSLFLLAPIVMAQEPPAAQSPTPPLKRQDTIEVVATRIPELPSLVPAAIEVITGDELRDRGVTDLRGALALAAGVEISSGGDGGPASAVPAFWGLKEFDAFLLVVDGVPLGGALNPAIAALSLTDVDRVEVLRGPAPVMYGATSFVGVINVVHKNAADAERTLSVHGGNSESAGILFSSKLPFSARWDSRITFDADRQGFPDDRTSYRRGHALWRNSLPWGSGRFWFSLDGLWLDQSPASPSPRVGTILSPLVLIDVNHNPDGAFLNDHRVSGMLGFDRAARGATWSTTVSLSDARQDILRGFLSDVSDAAQNARGIRQKIDLTDVYVDSHLAWQFPKGFKLVSGGDYLHSGGNAQGADFDYHAPLSGGWFPPEAQVPAVLDVHITDRRDFAGAYVSGEWNPVRRVRLDAGLRLNLTREERGGGEGSDSAEAEGPAQRNTRFSGTLGAIVTAWEEGLDHVRLFVNYRDTFKPAAFDFGLGDADAGGLLDPETSRSYEAGVKASFLQGRMTSEVSSFSMNFNNMVIAQTVNGLPSLTNAGKERFRGIETAVAYYLTRHISGRATYSFHNAKFQDFNYEFDPGVPTQLAGKRLEMSPRHLAAFGVVYASESGPLFGVDLNYVGSRFLNKRNTALADGYVTVGASAGYRIGKYELRLDGRNLGNNRAPVAESELGDAQYYRLTARHFDLTLSYRF